MNKNNEIRRAAFVLITACLLVSCKSGPFNLIKPASPHEQYERKLINAGLNQTAMGQAWINNGAQSLQRALAIKLPYQEHGYFSAEQPVATAFRFNVVNGQQLNIQVKQKPQQGLMIYADVWRLREGQTSKFLVAADTLGNPIQLDVDQTGEFILRLQPELLGAGEYTLSIQVGPSLAYPLKSANRNQIQSLYGVGRDNNTRTHEGIDIFAPFRTPVVAVADGTVTRVNTNNLGGKVVWLRPDQKNYTLYYAHLDEQTVTEGQRVLVGDTLGRMGNTGNAITTSPHLHFGIYTNGGTVDPLPFVNPQIAAIPKIHVDTDQLNATMRTSTNTVIGTRRIQAGTIIRVNAAAGSSYRVQLPDGEAGYALGKDLKPAKKPLSTYKISRTLPVYDRPDTAAAVKSNLDVGQTVGILGSFGDFQLMVAKDDLLGWILRPK